VVTLGLTRTESPILKGRSRLDRDGEPRGSGVGAPAATSSSCNTPAQLDCFSKSTVHLKHHRQHQLEACGKQSSNTRNPPCLGPDPVIVFTIPMSACVMEPQPNLAHKVRIPQAQLGTRKCTKFPHRGLDTDCFTRTLEPTRIRPSSLRRCRNHSTTPTCPNAEVGTNKRNPTVPQHFQFIILTRPTALFRKIYRTTVVEEGCAGQTKVQPQTTQNNRHHTPRHVSPHTFGLDSSPTKSRDNTWFNSHSCTRIRGSRGDCAPADTQQFEIP
jgi:hypothetical protein